MRLIPIEVIISVLAALEDSSYFLTGISACAGKPKTLLKGPQDAAVSFAQVLIPLN